MKDLKIMATILLILCALTYCIPPPQSAESFITKEGVDLGGLSPHIDVVLLEADSIWEEFGQEMVITAGLDGVHSVGSLHYLGLAVDLRTRYFTNEEKEVIAYKLQDALKKFNIHYQVVVHRTHIHVEYDIGS